MNRLVTNYFSLGESYYEPTQPKVVHLLPPALAEVKMLRTCLAISLSMVCTYNVSGMKPCNAIEHFLISNDLGEDFTVIKTYRIV